jgi:hypothetical protein
LLATSNAVKNIGSSLRTKAGSIYKVGGAKPLSVEAAIFGRL